MKSLQQALNALFSFNTWLKVLMPPFLAGVVLLGLFIFYWSPLLVFASKNLSELKSLQWISNNVVPLQELSPILAAVLILLAFIPILFIVVLLVTSICVTPIVQREVSKKYFQNLVQKKGGSNVGSLMNSLRALSIFLVLFVVTLPLWLIPGLQIIVPAILIIWMNKVIFVYDVLQDFASEEERKIIEKKDASGLWILGSLLVLMAYIPFVVFILPAFTAFAYSFYTLNSLETLRNASSKP